MLDGLRLGGFVRIGAGSWLAGSSHDAGPCLLQAREMKMQADVKKLEERMLQKQAVEEWREQKRSGRSYQGSHPIFVWAAFAY